MNPYSGLAFVYALHILATVIWVGGLISLALLVMPAARQALGAQEYAGLVGRIQARLQPIGWFCLVVLAGTGLFQLSANPHYQGFLAIANPWAVAILIKHLVFGIMIVVSAYLTWGFYPQMSRMALRAAAGKAPQGALEGLRRREETLLWVNVGLSAAVLLLTAYARAA